MKHLYEIWLLLWLAIPWCLGVCTLLFLALHFYFKWLWGNLYEGDGYGEMTKYDYSKDSRQKLVAIGEKAARPVHVVGDTLLEMGRLGYLTGTALEDYEKITAKEMNGETKRH